MTTGAKSRNFEDIIRDEIFSVERLEQYAEFLASELKVTKGIRGGRSLLPRLEENNEVLNKTYREFAQIAGENRPLPPASEWLVDNFHIIEDQVREVREDLPEGYYNELPKLMQGELVDYPRVYAIALTLIAHLDSRLETATVKRFVQAYQRVSPLMMGELWAIAITLRIALVENMRRICMRLRSIQEVRDEADRFADKLLKAMETSPDEADEIMKGLPLVLDRSPACDCAFIVQLSKRLRDQAPEFYSVFNRLEECLQQRGLSVEQVIHLDHRNQAADQVTVGNIIGSMRLLSSIDWKDFFESVSLVDEKLAHDPTDTYRFMDFTSRDRYRHAIERICRRTGLEEVALSRQVLELACQAQAQGRRHHEWHVGYYLVDGGVGRLEEMVGYKGTALERAERMLLAYPTFFYLSSLAIVIWAVVSLVILAALAAGAGWLTIVLTAVLASLPASDMVINLVNMLTTRLVRPRILPKIDLPGGIPAGAAAFVVVPTIFGDKDSIHRILESLEIHYLANQDENLSFAILSDYADADEESRPEDAGLLRILADGIVELNRQYCPSSRRQFFLFHRRRVWNPVELKWMGWERKRGKLHEFNRYMRGDRHTTFVVAPEREPFFANIRYVITLDSDTQIPKDVARRLIGTILHPLNEPRLDERRGMVSGGYGILQPRISITPKSSQKSFFAQILSGHTGIDPYTMAVSDVYQDLFGEGIYTGKGLYVLDAFEASVAGRAPENAILSHDLFEGLFARPALVTDIELLDDYPAHYEAYAKRQHRWTRGDWQVTGWIFSRVGLPLIARWKIFDNLRRSLVAPATMLWLILAWTYLPGSQLAWTLGIVGLLIFPAAAHASNGLLFHPRGIPWTSQFWNVWGDFRTSVSQILLYMIVLPHQAYLQLDAISRVAFRKLVSRRGLLQWTTAREAESDVLKRKGLSWDIIWPTEIVAWLMVGYLVEQAKTGQAVPLDLYLASVPFIAVWIGFPLVISLISRVRPVRMWQPSAVECAELRLIARRTWHFFENFVNEDSHWLPPDNYQENPKPVVAYRTSPTNIGLYLISAVAAYDFGFIGGLELLERLERTIDAMDKLERWHGHFYNWYEIGKPHPPRPLGPLYISMVDSGNLAGHLIALKQACLNMPEPRGIRHETIFGLVDAIEEMKAKVASITSFKLATPSVAPSQLLTEVDHCLEAVRSRPAKDSEAEAWRDYVHRILTGLRAVSDLVEALAIVHGANEFGSLSEWTSVATRSVVNLKAQVDAVADPAFQDQYAERFHRLARKCDEFIDAMDFRIVFDEERKLFVIGFNVEDGRPDNSYYDLLASEARLGSFVAIAKGDVEQSHWLHLGRQMTSLYGRRTLISWSASMFEYLMPLLVMKDFRDTLLHETYLSVVAQQIKHGAKTGAPWGVSESAYNGRDMQMNYQYGPFGIPGLGLKRGLSDNLVISPYATALAALVEPVDALENFRRLREEGLLTDYGFYEAIDYTRERRPSDQEKVVIHSFMAHHQGMTLVALDNVLKGGIMQERFHAEPSVRAVDLLLQERVPLRVGISHPRAEEVAGPSASRETPPPAMRFYSTPHSNTPQTLVLSNGEYSVMITAAGSGYSRCERFAVTRWAEDPTRDAMGTFIYIKDTTSGEIWSATYQPVGKEPRLYEVIFNEHKAEFRRRDNQTFTHTEIVVSPEDNVEIRLVTLTNFSDEPRELEVTSYLEPVIAPPEADLAHPAFSKLFVQTEYIAPRSALLAKRRPRSTTEPEIWGLHVVTTSLLDPGPTEYETDRAKFIQRGRQLANPAQVDGEQPLSGTVGTPLDPIFSLRKRIIVPPHTAVKVSFATGVAPSRDQALRLIDRYHDIQAFDREQGLAWLQSQVEMRHLGIRGIDATLYQRVAGSLLYSNVEARGRARFPQDSSELTQSGLWPFGISGDLPILFVRIRGDRDLPLAREALKVHQYLRMKKLVFDVVILNDERSGYRQPLQEEIVRQLHMTGYHGLLNKSGGIFVLRSDLVDDEARRLLQTTARVSLDGDRGSFREQILRARTAEASPVRPVRGAPSASRARQSAELPEEVRELPRKLKMFNGLGGFDEESGEYVILLSEGRSTPLPWANVVANSSGFGFVVSESGGGYAWSLNCRENRLTPWSNDPILDPNGEIFYVRDDETSEVWSATPWPIRSRVPYVIRHGQGYTRFTHDQKEIRHELTMFVPERDEIKICRLKLKNLSASRRRRLSVAYFVEWVLGTQRMRSFEHIVCSQSAEQSGVLLARNPFSIDFGSRIAFAGVSGGISSFTCDRREFLGPNGSYALPAGLVRGDLRGRTEAGIDPCAALLKKIVLKPLEEIEIVFVLGEAPDMKGVDRLVDYYLRGEVLAKCTHALEKCRNFWADALGVLQFKTPSPEIDLLLNRWLLYQTLACRIWARTGFYQSGGAFGFRDQLQDVTSLLWARPDLAREHILLAAKHQFTEGDVLHWWHPPTDRGVRTHFSDDLLWLPYVTCQYVRQTGDYGILDEVVPFLKPEPIPKEREDLYFEPQASGESGTLFEHCARAIDRSLKTGAHGLPLMGTGDWNDGMNMVGHLGQGESVWMAWFLAAVLRDFTPLCAVRNQKERLTQYQLHLESLKQAVETNGWDGKWYRRAYFDDGTPLGSVQNDECQIDSIAQSWAVLSGLGSPERARQAMQEVSERLILRDEQVVLLFAPSFNKTSLNPGYIKGYVPGIRENGGQYTHAAIWAAMAFAELGESERAMEILAMVNPIAHATSWSGIHKYKVEPYVVAADVYGVAPHTGRGGWTWYTGSAGWYYRAIVESILGLRRAGNELHLKPCLPPSWSGFEISLRMGGKVQRIFVRSEIRPGRNVPTIVVEFNGQTREAEAGKTITIDMAELARPRSAAEESRQPLEETI